MIRIGRILFIIAILFIIVAAYVLSMARPVSCIETGDNGYLYADFYDGKRVVRLKVSPIQYEILVPLRSYYITHDNSILIDIEKY